MKAKNVNQLSATERECRVRMTLIDALVDATMQSVQDLTVLELLAFTQRLTYTVNTAYQKMVDEINDATDASMNN